MPQERSYLGVRISSKEFGFDAFRAKPTAIAIPIRPKWKVFLFVVVDPAKLFQNI